MHRSTDTKNHFLTVSWTNALPVDLAVVRLLWLLYFLIDSQIAHSGVISVNR